jgi:hypothetical protein
MNVSEKPSTQPLEVLQKNERVTSFREFREILESSVKNSKKMLCRNTLFMICHPPLRQPCPQGGGGVNDASVLPVLGAFLDAGNTASSQPGDASSVRGRQTKKSVLYASYHGFLQSKNKMLARFPKG